jgi:hypothetical protein
MGFFRGQRSNLQCHVPSSDGALRGRAGCFPGGSRRAPGPLRREAAVQAVCGPPAHSRAALWRQLPGVAIEASFPGDGNPAEGFPSKVSWSTTRNPGAHMVCAVTWPLEELGEAVDLS